MAFTVMVGASFRARCRVSWCTAALDAEYEYDSSTGTWIPSIDPMLMTRDGFPGVEPASRRIRKNLVVWNTPCTLRSRTRCHEAVSWSARGAPQVAPAL